MGALRSSHGHNRDEGRVRRRSVALQMEFESVEFHPSNTVEFVESLTSCQETHCNQMTSSTRRTSVKATLSLSAMHSRRVGLRDTNIVFSVRWKS